MLPQRQGPISCYLREIEGCQSVSDNRITSIQKTVIAILYCRIRVCPGEVRLGFDGFAQWMNHAQQPTQPPEMPWEVAGAKQPEDYTWEDFEALTVAQQIAFQNYLGEAAFETWLNRVLG